MRKIFFLIIFCFIFLSSCSQTKNEKVLHFEEVCINNTGNFIKKTNECEWGIEKELCKKLGGDFNNCASSCRNVKSRKIACTQECIEVCKI